MTESNKESIEQTKKCSKCGEVKDVNLFSKNRNRKDGLKSECKSCYKTYQKAYHEANREAIRAKSKTYYEANKENKLAYQKTYREANRDTIIAKDKKYYEANKDTILAKSKAYREANREAIYLQRKAYREANRDVITLRKKAYREANRDSHNEKSAARRAMKKTNTPKFIRDCSVDKKRRVFSYNLSRLLTETTGVQHQVDHMWPISDGGPHWSGNLQVIPAVENIAKSDKVDEEIKKTIKEGLEYARQCYERGEVC
jgi:hypothetical protein